jgi:hypothetical protein
MHMLTACGEFVVKPGKKCMYGVFSIRNKSKRNEFENRVRDLDGLKIDIEHTGRFGDDSVRTRCSQESLTDGSRFDRTKIETIDVVPILSI